MKMGVRREKYGNSRKQELEEAIFKHSIRELDLSGEKLSADPKAAENFIEKFKIKAESYDPEFLYKADETAFPKTTLAAKRETSAPSHKVSKACFTMMNCANLYGKPQNTPSVDREIEKPPGFQKCEKTSPLLQESTKGLDK
ncbi:hypothetical protein PR048_013218 [Dryococelus australis]|uniref:Uncharacterized protein n=1 Tax=Dryococelus australis TaxID=614101 RepID=A0ABQ9HSD0_9NEOP|nr:hypothetical protein PR048_013218 [Dryococelus australis]